MSVSAKLSKDGGTLVVHVPMSFRKRGGRKLIVVPEGASWAPQRARIDNAMVRALARAIRWRKQLETGARASVELRLTLLAPEIVEAILDVRSAEMTLAALMEPFAVGWHEQAKALLRSWQRP